MILKNCAFCGEEFSVEVSSKNQKFCSKTCARKNQHRYKNKNLEKAVPMLKNEIIPEWNIVIYLNKQFFAENLYKGTVQSAMKCISKLILNEEKITTVDIHLRKTRLIKEGEVNE